MDGWLILCRMKSESHDEKNERDGYIFNFEESSKLNTLLSMKISKMYFFILTGLMNTTNLKGEISQPLVEEGRLKITEPLLVRATNVSEPPHQRVGNEQTAHANLFLCALHSIHADSNYWFISHFPPLTWKIKKRERIAFQISCIWGIIFPNTAWMSWLPTGS